MNTDRPTLPYGSWPSPLTIDLVIAGSRSLGSPWLDGDDLYVLEGRPAEGGRVVLMRRASDGAIADVTPEGFNVRTRVHEYGGGAYTVSGGRVVFSNFTDDRLYVQATPTALPAALTEAGRKRFADLRVDEVRERALAVLEDHTQDDHEPQNALVAVSLADGVVTTLVDGRDFFSDPRLDAAGERLCWLTWDRPNMPWDGTELWVARIAADGSVAGARCIAGGPDESIVQPVWAPDGSLVFASDRTGWWNLYRWWEGAGDLEPLAPMEAEFADAAWVFGLRYTGIDDDGTILAVARSDGRDRLNRLGPGGPIAVALDATEIGGLVVKGGVAALIAGSPVRPTALLRLGLASGAVESVRTTGDPGVGPEYLSAPRHVRFPTTGGRSAHAHLYLPANPDVRPPDGERPPLLVLSHGGPTSSASTRLDLAIQAFTSRGFAVVDVDYRGSTGYGRAFRNELRASWGIVDLEDCTNVALWLADEGIVDRRRMAISGGSAGGFTTLAALCFRNVFGAGASHFGVGDLEGLARDTHKFESRYLDLLVAPYPGEVAVYRERSPIHHVDGISCPVLVLQGEDDRVVPKEQAEVLVAALARKGLPHAYLLFPGEGHGFRRAENQRRALEAELSFFAQVFGFGLADAIEPVEIIGLASR